MGSCRLCPLTGAHARCRSRRSRTMRIPITSKRIPLGLTLLGVIGIGGCSSADQGAEQSTEQSESSQPPVEEPASFGRNASFTIDGAPVTLVDGVARTPSATTRYLGNETEGDLNGDGLEDLAFWVTR